MPMKCTVLIENSGGSRQGLVCEHGLSVLIETGDRQLLFDTGSSGHFLDNAAVLGFQLEKTLSMVVLSHNHYDHTDGLPRLAESSLQSLEVHVGPDFFRKKYALEDDGTLKYSGSRCTPEDLNRLGHRVVEHRAPCTQLLQDVYLLTSFSSQERNPRFKVFREGVMEVDGFGDESVIVLNTSERLVVLSGCAHPGILTILEGVRSQFARPVIALLGGTHLMDSSGEQLEKTAAALTHASLKLLGCSHCTGSEAVHLLKRSSAYGPFHTGDSYIFY